MQTLRNYEKHELSIVLRVGRIVLPGGIFLSGWIWLSIVLLLSLPF